MTGSECKRVTGRSYERFARGRLKCNRILVQARSERPSASVGRYRSGRSTRIRDRAVTRRVEINYVESVPWVVADFGSDRNICIAVAREHERAASVCAVLDRDAVLLAVALQCLVRSRRDEHVLKEQLVGEIERFQLPAFDIEDDRQDAVVVG